MRMQLQKSASFVREGAHAASTVFGEWFPTPVLLSPRAAGVDISDASIKWLALIADSDRYRIEAYGEEPLAPGIVANGTIMNEEALTHSLAAVHHKLGGIRYAHAALPEEAAYVFNMHVPEGTSHEQALRMIEFEFEGRVPIAPSAAVYDFDVIQRHGGPGEEIGVSVFPRELSKSYQSAFEAAGVTLLSLEVEARSIARAVSDSSSNEPITLLVDFGRARTGFAVLKRGIPIFTSTVEVGGDAITKALVEKLSLSEADAEAFKNEKGLLLDAKEKSAAYETVVATASALADEVARHFHYWDTRRNEHGERVTPVGRVLLVGGSANLRGLADYIASRVQAPTEVGDVWRHVCDFEKYIPPIDWHHSLQYATAIGLALRSL
ncbi:pilus assembly protein PilM [Candidatus Kaiserbacteria bacterium]|nr:pilus assembly protein PilM [Candidatus Kaiserbacteria bacterium]